MVGGVVLAGGHGARLGRPKANVDVAGRTLAQRAIGLLRLRCDGEVVAVAPPALTLANVDVHLVHDAGVGAMEALAAGLTAIDVDDALVLACDLPLAGPLLDRLVAAGAPAVAEGQPLCGLYPRAATLEALPRAARLTELPALLGATIVTAHGEELLNVNTPRDLAHVSGALARLARHGGAPGTRGG